MTTYKKGQQETQFFYHIYEVLENFGKYRLIKSQTQSRNDRFQNEYAGTEFTLLYSAVSHLLQFTNTPYDFIHLDNVFIPKGLKFWFI